MRHLICSCIFFLSILLSLSLLAQLVVVYYLGQSIFLGAIASMAACFGFTGIYIPHLKAAINKLVKEHQEKR